MSQPLEIVNSTDHFIKGEVTYMTIFCASHYFFVEPNSDWLSEKRGICPIVEISAEIKTPRGTFKAKPFFSIGTKQSRFEVVELRENIFKVLKIKTSRNIREQISEPYEHSYL